MQQFSIIQKHHILILAICFSVSMRAQTAQRADDVSVTISDIVQHEGFYAVTLTSSGQFIVGGNRYVLHVGSKQFLRCLHPDGDLSKLVFYLPDDDYEAITSSDAVYLVYGLYEENIVKMQGKEAELLGLHWKLDSIKK